MSYPVPPPEPLVVDDVLNADAVVLASVPFAAIALDSASTTGVTATDLVVPSPPEVFPVAVRKAPALQAQLTETESLPLPTVPPPDSNTPPEPTPTAPSDSRINPSPSDSNTLPEPTPTAPSDPRTNPSPSNGNLTPEPTPLEPSDPPTAPSSPPTTPTPVPDTPAPSDPPAILLPPGLPPVPPGVTPDVPPDAPPVVPAETVTLRGVEVVGSTILRNEDLSPITQPLIGRPVTQADLQAATDAITQIYLNQGYITSRALDPVVTDGVAQIRVVEGSLEQIDIQGTERLHPRYIRDRIQLGARTPLNTNALEDQLRLLRQNPLLENVEASLRAGSQFGQSILVVRVTEANALTGTVSVANDSPPSVGSERMGLDLAYRNLTGNGDTLGSFYRRSTTGGAESYGVNYSIPLNARDGTLQLRVERNRHEITQEPFDELGIRGANTLYDLSYRQPLVRSPQEEFALSLGFTFQDGQTFLFDNTPFPFGLGVEADGVSRTSVIRFGQDYVRRDRRGAWALRSQFNLGTGLLDATSNEGSLPDGQFVSWLGQAQRVQSLGEDHLLIMQADLQLTPDGLLPSQQFVIGGGQSVRGYRQNARSGDNGFRFSMEDRITIQRDEASNPTLQIAPFIDAGAVWNHPDNPRPRQNFLAGVGVGVLWNPLPAMSVRLDYGIPLISISDRGENAQDDGFYFRVGYQF